MTTRQRYIAGGLVTVLCIVAAMILASREADRRLLERLGTFLSSVKGVQKGMSASQVRAMLGEPAFAGVVGKGQNHVALIACGERGGPQVLAYKFEFRTWTNVFSYVSEDWFVICLDETGHVTSTSLDTVRP